MACHLTSIRCYVLPIQVRLLSFGIRNESECCCLNARAAQQMKDACASQALLAMMRCVSSEHPHISWQARDMSANQTMLEMGSLSTLAAESAAGVADGANVTSAPLLLPSAGVQREDVLHEAVGSGILAPCSDRDSAWTVFLDSSSYMLLGSSRPLEGQRGPSLRSLSLRRMATPRSVG